VAIALADEARNREDWEEAERNYTKALEQSGALDAIWVQQGHTLKEQGKYPQAIESYRRAISLDPAAAEPYVHIAHAFKHVGMKQFAIRNLVAALYLGHESEAEEIELLTLLRQAGAEGNYEVANAAIKFLDTLPAANEEAAIITTLRNIVDARSSALEALDSDDVDAATVFDVSDLIGFWRNARLPTGIQRVQIEAIAAELDKHGDRAVHLCCFTDGRDDWLEVPVATFFDLVTLATKDGDTNDAVWQRALSDLHLHLTLSVPFVFPKRSMLVNLGTSWWLRNYFLYVRQAKENRQIRYVPFVHDMIPIMTPQHCTSELTQDFISWVLGVFDHADHFLANSNATRKDLIKVAQELGHTLAEEDVAVIPLNSDFRKAGVELLAEEELEKWSLKNGEFVLFVSTIESRKGHLLAFDAWSKLIAKHGPDKIPKFVCVGNRGWLNDEIYHRLETDETLSKHVVMLSRLSDAELALLYRTCAFTVYPSTYEGWGLPVTESLCYGKVALISDAASLPEAGGDFAIYFTSGSEEELTRQAEHLILDPDYRSELETKIVENFCPRSWAEVAHQIAEELDEFQQNDETAAEMHKGSIETPLAHIGRWHSMTRNTSTRIWQGMSSAEKYRSNLGWYWPEDRGCRVKNESGKLKFKVNTGHSGLRIYLALHGDENVSCQYLVNCEVAADQGVIERDQSMWVWLDLPACDEPREYQINCNATRKPNGDLPTYFLRGFFLCRIEETSERMNFIEALSLDRLDMLDAFGPSRTNIKAV